MLMPVMSVYMWAIRNKRRSLSWALGVMACLAVSSPAEEVSFLITNKLMLFGSPFADTPESVSRSISNLVIPSAGLVHLATWKKDDFGYNRYVYSTLSKWSTAGTNPIARGEGFWLYTAQAPETTVTFAGALATASVITNTFNSSFSMVGYPYLAPVAINSMRLTNNLTPYLWGDRIYTWDYTAQVYRCFFYDGGGALGGGWQDADNPGRPASYVLQPMEGFWFIKKSATPITWRASAP